MNARKQVACDDGIEDEKISFSVLCNDCSVEPGTYIVGTQ